MSSLIQQVTGQMTAVAGIAGGQVNSAEKDNDFAGVFRTALGDLNRHVQDASRAGQQFDAGDSHISLNDVMLDIQKATLSLQLGTQVRNKLVNAYTDIMNMSV